MEIRLANLLGAMSLAISDRLLGAVAAKVGCGASAPAALVTLLAQPGIGVTELGTKIGLSQPATARLVTAMATLRLVKRQPGKDGRSVALYVTPHGHEKARLALAARERAIKELIATLDPEEQQALQGVLEKLLAQLLQDEGRPFVLCRLCDRPACIADGNICPVGTAARSQGIDAG